MSIVVIHKDAYTALKFSQTLQRHCLTISVALFVAFCIIHESTVEVDTMCHMSIVAIHRFRTPLEFPQKLHDIASQVMCCILYHT